MNPLLSILESGSTSVFLMISRFFQAVESLLAMREEFGRAFSPESAVSQGIGLFEKIQDLKFNKLLPAKMRFLLNVQDNSDELGQMVELMFACVQEIVQAKIEVIESVGRFFENKIDFISGFSGPGMTPQMILEAVQSGNLFQLLNFGPVHQSGLPGISERELEKTIRSLLAMSDPSLPGLGSVKPLLVDHRILGQLSGRLSCILIGRDLQSGEIFSYCCSNSSLCAIKNQPMAPTPKAPSSAFLAFCWFFMA